jgi:alpha-L-fucosidase
LRRYRETNEIAARTQGGERRSKLKGKEEELLKIIVTEQSDICLREIQEEIKECKGIEVSISSLSRTLNRFKLRRKKTLLATEQATELVQKLRYEFRRWLDTIDIKNLVVFDETGVNLLAMTRNYGRCQGGARVYYNRPGNKGKNFTLIGAMSDEALIATMTFPGSLNTASFFYHFSKVMQQ